MQTRTLSYAEHEDAIVSLVTYLGAHEGRDGRDSAAPGELAGFLGLEKDEVSAVLDGFRGIFRRSQKAYETREHGAQYRYTLHLRYARRKYIDGQIAGRGEPLSNDDLFGLLGFITGRIEEEHENKRHSKSAHNTMVGVWVAGSMSLVAAVLGLIGLLVK